MVAIAVLFAVGLGGTLGQSAGSVAWFTGGALMTWAGLRLALGWRRTALARKITPGRRGQRVRHSPGTVPGDDHYRR